MFRVVCVVRSGDLMSIVKLHEERARVEASQWVARLQRDELDERDGLAFEAWLVADPTHEAAYLETVSVWQEFEVGADSVLAELEKRPSREVRDHPQRGKWIAASGGLAVAAGLMLVLLAPAGLSLTDRFYTTAKGQHQRVELADGSIMDLNAETRLRVAYRRSERRIVLDSGEAVFDVVHDLERPFVVAASGRTITDVGTLFDVKNRDGAVVVTVAKGEVRVSPDKAVAQSYGYNLKPGQRLEFKVQGGEALRTVDPSEAVSWRTRRLVYRDRPLSEVIADMNHQFTEQVVIEDGQLADIPITGVVVLDDPRAVIARLSLILPLRSVSSERGLLLQRK
jgi:transmembrane sensor